MKKQWVLLALMLSSSLYGASQDGRAIHSTMGELADNLQEIFPIIFTSGPELEQKHDVLKANVKSLLKSFDKAKPHVEQRTIAFKASYEIMQQHLIETDKLLNHNQVVRASERLKVLPSLCVSCHTQDAKQKQYFIGLDRNHFGSDYQFAEFSFTTRDYGTAITYFDKFLTNKGAHKSKDHTQTALERLLTLYLQVDHEPAMAATYLQEYVPFIVQYPDIKLRLQSWVEQLNTLPQQYQDLLSGKRPLRFEALQNIATSLESPSPNKNQTVRYVILRGLIHSYLDGGTKETEVAPLLYWLALADKRLNYQYYHSYADIYLKECFSTYPKSPYAPMCKKEYYDYAETS